LGQQESQRGFGVIGRNYQPPLGKNSQQSKWPIKVSANTKSKAPAKTASTSTRAPAGETLQDAVDFIDNGYMMSTPLEKPERRPSRSKDLGHS